MKKILIAIIAAVALFASCNDYETYGDKKKKEREAIAKFIADSAIVVITEDQFNEQACITNVQRNEFVKLDKSGVYMQIVRTGCGTEIEDGETTDLVCRFSEYDILNDTLSLYNNVDYFVAMPDIIHVSRTGGTYTGNFTDGVMLYYVGASVPAGWLVTLPFIQVGRPESFEDECAKVRLIVPHSQGHATASSNVKPYYYEITLQRKS